MPQVVVLPQQEPLSLRGVKPQCQKCGGATATISVAAVSLEPASRELTADGALPFANPCLTLSRNLLRRKFQRGSWLIQLLESRRQGDLRHGIHPVAGRNRILECRGHHKLQEFLGQFRLLAGRSTGGDFHLQIVAFAKVGCGVVVFLSAMM